MKYKLKTKSGVLVLSTFCLVLMICSNANALGPVEVPETWGGDLSSRQRLTGDWGGVRDEMAKKGVELDANMFLLPGGVFSGGRNTGAELWGNVDYTLNIDTDKLGLCHRDVLHRRNYALDERESQFANH